jgi:hypothetical protein
MVARSSVTVEAITTYGRTQGSRRRFALPVKIKSRHLANKILKEAGLEKVF